MPWDRRSLLASATRALGSLVLAGGSRSCRPGHPQTTVPRPAKVAPPDVDVLFRPGSPVVLHDGASARIRVHHAGTLRLTTGRLIGADPAWLPDWQRLGISAYTRTVPPGDYPLTLAMAQFRMGDGTDGAIVSAAKLTIHDSRVARWEPALQPGQDPAMLSDGEFFGIGVDTASIGLFDAAALPAMARRAERELEAFTVWHANHIVELDDSATGANLIAFQSGEGDGHYPPWVGRTLDGKIACYVVDMLTT